MIMIKTIAVYFFKLLNTKLRKHFHRFKCHLNKVNYFYRAHTAFSAKIYGNERISILCHEFKIKVEIIASQKKDDITMILINKDLEMQRLAKTNDKNRRFGVIMTPLSRRNKE